jgi:hypothetical protein
MTSTEQASQSGPSSHGGGSRSFLRVLALGLAILALATASSYMVGRELGPKVPEAGSCVPTERYHMAESYRPGAPYRSKVGDGSVLYTGSVRVWPTCLPVAGVSVDVWYTDVDGFYNNETRLQVRTDMNGDWSMRTGPLSPDVRPYHVHLKVYGPGIRPMTTAQYPDSSTSGGRYDLVVLEANGEGPEGFLETEPSSGESDDDVKKKKEGQR